MAYTVLARRYRSGTFDEVVGQEPIAQTLKNAIATDHVAHAYLFTGTRGVGKTTMARILAKALNCLSVDEPTTEPCGKCDSCVAVAEGEDIDVLEIDAASNTGVEHVRELRQNAIYRPARGRLKIYIIDEVHMLSVSAFNALLKTLEEPPEHVKFILATTEPNKILPTILSRCQRFDFRNIQPGQIAAQLQKILRDESVEAEDALLRRLGRLANGSMRDALSLLDQLLSVGEGKLTLDMLGELLGVVRSERIVEIVDAIAENDLADVLERTDIAIGEGVSLEQLAESLQSALRDLLVIRNCGPQTELVETDDPAVRGKITEQAKKFDDAYLVYGITVMEELRRSIRSSGSGRALLEAALVRLTASERFSDTKVLLEQLQSLPQSGSAESPNRPIATAHNKTATASRPPQGRPVTSNEKPTAGGVQAESSVVPTDKIDLRYITENWQQILSQMASHGAGHLHGYLKSSEPIAWDAPLLEIGYPENAADMAKLFSDISDGIGQAEKAFGEILQVVVKLKLNVRKVNGRNIQQQPTAKKIVPPGAKPSQKEIDAALSDQRVRRIQETLGGKVRQVRRSEPRENDK